MLMLALKHFSYAMLAILCKYGISCTSLVAEQMLGMIKDYFRETRSLSKKRAGGINLLFSRTLIKDNVPA